jgi:double-stranded uracil-DNA glycosylase
LSLSSGFPAIESPDARILILGSLPGVLSIAAGEYYAHPRNNFWAIMEAVLDIPLRCVPYRTRAVVLKDRKIALWDVLASAHREGSLDVAIRNDTANDLVAFVASHSALSLICFNGRKAAALYKRHVAQPELSSSQCMTLPSTSPAHTVGLEAKVREWSIIRQYL